MIGTKLNRESEDLEENNESSFGTSDENSESENENSVDEFDTSQKKRIKNEGWADSMAKILRSNKPKGKSTIVLAKAKKLNEIKEKSVDLGFEIENEVKEEKPDLELSEKELKTKENKKKKKDIGEFRVKPSILDKDRERTLSKIATRGVVQLFNAVRAQQRDINNKLKEAGPLERKQSKVLQNIDKRAFLDVLMGGERSISQQVDQPVKSEIKEDKTDSKWNVLRNDFMLESKLKDWDKDDSSEDEQDA